MSNFGVYPKIEKRMKSQKRSWEKFCDLFAFIEKVYENGELAIRYQYDALNRLIREDNKVMSTTVLYSYDNNGNILKQRKFAFTLKNIIDIEELESEDKVYIYDGD